MSSACSMQYKFHQMRVQLEVKLDVQLEVQWRYCYSERRDVCIYMNGNLPKSLTLQSRVFYWTMYGIIEPQWVPWGIRFCSQNPVFKWHSTTWPGFNEFKIIWIQQWKQFSTKDNLTEESHGRTFAMINDFSIVMPDLLCDIPIHSVPTCLVNLVAVESRYRADDILFLYKWVKRNMFNLTLVIVAADSAEAILT